MKLAIGSDHGGYELKEYLLEYLATREDVEVVDFGTNSPASVDYPIYGQAVAQAVTSGECDRGIAICGTGVGISIAVNKFKGIRASLCTNEFMAEMTRRHNNSNVLVLGGRVVGLDLGLNILKTWLDTPFEGERHQRRLDMITEIENGATLE